MKLISEALCKFFAGVILVGVLLFLSAGSLSWGNGWLFMGVLFLPMLAAGIVMLCKAPELLRKRLDIKEKQGTQKGAIGGIALAFLSGFIVAGLDFRFGWSCVPLWVVIPAVIIFLAAYLMYAEVLRENAYLSRTVKVEDGQTVIDTGLYGILRHPMYTASILLFTMIPLVLGSWYALIPFGAYPVLIVIRLKGEEALLQKELPGYPAYMEKVKYRLIPFIW